MNESKKYHLGLLVVAVIAFFSLASVNASEGYRRVDLLTGKGVSIELPNNWVILSNRGRSDLQEFINSEKDSAVSDQAISDSLFFAVFKRTPVIVGIVQVYHNDINATQDYSRKITKQDIAEMNTAMKKGVVGNATTAKSHVQSWEGTNKATINGVTTLVSRYSLKDESGAVKNTCLVNVFDGERSFALNVAYLEGEQPSLKPVADRIINSLKLSGISDTSVDNLQAYTKPASGNTNSETFKSLTSFWVLLAVSAVYTWGIGLTPPLLIRFLFVRRPIGKWWAIGTTAMFFFVNVILFTILNEALSDTFEDLNIYKSKSHGALILVAAVSYFILRKKLKPKSQSGKNLKKRSGKYGWVWILFGLLCIYFIGMLVVFKDVKSLVGVHSDFDWQKGIGIAVLMSIVFIISGLIFGVRFLILKFRNNKKMAVAVLPCPNCSQLNTTNRRTCKKCGAILQEGDCPECKKPIRPGELYCSNCYPDGEIKTRELRDEISDIRDKTTEFWDKMKKKNKSITMEKKWATLIKGDTQAKVASIVGKPDSVENEGEDSTQERWIFECGSGSKRSITFKDGFMIKIEVKY